MAKAAKRLCGIIEDDRLLKGESIVFEAPIINIIAALIEP